MHSMLTRDEMVQKLPYGYTTTIAQKANVSKATVSNYLKGKNNNPDVEMAILEVLAELSKKKKELLAQIAN